MFHENTSSLNEYMNPLKRGSIYNGKCERETVMPAGVKCGMSHKQWSIKENAVVQVMFLSQMS